MVRKPVLNHTTLLLRFRVERFLSLCSLVRLLHPSLSPLLAITWLPSQLKVRFCAVLAGGKAGLVRSALG